MSRKVTLTVPVDIVVRDRDVHVLALVKKRSGASSHGVSASIRSFADELDVSLDTARRALASCEEAGYLTVRANRMKNGGQLENTYCVTKSGDGVIEAARRAGLDLLGSSICYGSQGGCWVWEALGFESEFRTRVFEMRRGRRFLHLFAQQTWQNYKR